MCFWDIPSIRFKIKYTQPQCTCYVFPRETTMTRYGWSFWANNVEPVPLKALFLLADDLLVRHNFVVAVFISPQPKTERSFSFFILTSFTSFETHILTFHTFAFHVFHYDGNGWYCCPFILHTKWKTSCTTEKESCSSMYPLPKGTFLFNVYSTLDNQLTTIIFSIVQ